ncbi:MAG: hypothetical protein SV422_03690, partial [Pseudomonadota bacterium]|nr:hypothetical protein [Pseudomonadota bacterium]
MDGLYARYTFPPFPDAESGQQSRQIFTIYNLYRLVLALILLISFYFRVPTSPLGAVDARLFLNICLFYAGFNVLTLLVPLVRLPPRIESMQRSAVLIIDILTLALISYTCGGVNSGMAHLLIVPIAAGSILFGIRMSTFYAAIATIAAIYSEVVGYLSASPAESYYVQAGLLGFTLFAT